MLKIPIELTRVKLIAQLVTSLKAISNVEILLNELFSLSLALKAVSLEPFSIAPLLDDYPYQFSSMLVCFLLRFYLALTIAPIS